MAVENPVSGAPDAPHGANSTSTSYNDWPNDAGVSMASRMYLFLLMSKFQFEVFHEAKTPVALQVSGKIPAHAA